MKRYSHLGIASVVAWLVLVTSALADDSTTPVDTREPPVAGSSAQDSVLVHKADASSVLPLGPAARNALFLEVLGPGIVFSLNYERIVVGQVAVRAGFAPWLWSLWASEAKLNFAVPLTIAYIGWQGLEVGGGITFLSDRAPIATTLVGYRLHPRGGAGLQFRVGGMMIAGKQIWHAGAVMPWLYLSAGAGFYRAPNTLKRRWIRAFGGVRWARGPTRRTRCYVEEVRGLTGPRKTAEARRFNVFGALA